MHSSPIFCQICGSFASVYNYEAQSDRRSQLLSGKVCFCIGSAYFVGLVFRDSLSLYVCVCVLTYKSVLIYFVQGEKTERKPALLFMWCTCKAAICSSKPCIITLWKLTAVTIVITDEVTS